MNLFEKICEAGRRQDHALLPAICDIDMRHSDDFGLSPAGLLAREGNSQGVDFLHAKGASAELICYGAAQGGQWALLDRWMGMDKAFISQAMQGALLFGHMDKVKTLLNDGGDQSDYVFAAAYHLARQEGKPDRAIIADMKALCADGFFDDALMGIVFAHRLNDLGMTWYEMHKEDISFTDLVYIVAWYGAPGEIDGLIKPFLHGKGKQEEKEQVIKYVIKGLARRGNKDSALLYLMKFKEVSIEIAIYGALRGGHWADAMVYLQALTDKKGDLVASRAFIKVAIEAGIFDPALPKQQLAFLAMCLGTAERISCAVKLAHHRQGMVIDPSVVTCAEVVVQKMAQSKQPYWAVMPNIDFWSLGTNAEPPPSGSAGDQAKGLYTMLEIPDDEGSMVCQEAQFGHASMQLLWEQQHYGKEVKSGGGSGAESKADASKAPCKITGKGSAQLRMFDGNSVKKSSLDCKPGSSPPKSDMDTITITPWPEPVNSVNSG